MFVNTILIGALMKFITAVIHYSGSMALVVEFLTFNKKKRNKRYKYTVQKPKVK